MAFRGPRITVRCSRGIILLSFSWVLGALVLTGGKAVTASTAISPISIAIISIASLAFAIFFIISIYDELTFSNASISTLFFIFSFLFYVLVLIF